MIKREDTNRFGWCRKGLRTKYRPRAMISRGLIDAAPWLNVLVLVFVFALLAPHVVVKPGISLSIPETLVAANAGGPSVTAVVQSHRQSPTNEVRSEMVFFDDEPFDVGDTAQMRQLRSRFASLVHDRPGIVLVIEADANVKYGTIARLCSIAAASGLKTVNLAGRSVEERARE